MEAGGGDEFYVFLFLCLSIADVGVDDTYDLNSSIFHFLVFLFSPPETKRSSDERSE